MTIETSIIINGLEFLEENPNQWVVDKDRHNIILNAVIVDSKLTWTIAWYYPDTEGIKATGSSAYEAFNKLYSKYEALHQDCVEDSEDIDQQITELQKAKIKNQQMIDLYNSLGDVLNCPF